MYPLVCYERIEKTGFKLLWETFQLNEYERYQCKHFIEHRLKNTEFDGSDNLSLKTMKS